MNARKQCYMLKELLGIKRLEEMYQRTGTPLHTAYAMVQLKDIYERKQNNPLNKCEDDENVKVWLSISSICISRWTNANILTMPISYSEASWTGKFGVKCRKSRTHVDALFVKYLATNSSSQKSNGLFLVSLS